MKYKIAIPSYKRPKIIQEKTLKYLKECNIDKEVITIFVANEEEEISYRQNGVVDYTIVVGVLGITNQRNFIKQYYDEGEYIISLDDDIERLEQAVEKKFIPIKELDNLFKESYEMMVREKRFIWGIYPARNIMCIYMRKEIHTDLKFIIGLCYGFINRKTEDLILNPELEGKEDIHQSILYYLKDGGVLRRNTIVAKTTFYAEGGLGKERSIQNKKATELICLKYPNLTRIVQRKNGTYEIRFR